MELHGVDRRAHDAHLIPRIQTGDEQALAELYDRYSGLLYSLLIRMLDERQAAEEVLQDVFLTVWQSSATWDYRKGSVQAWLVAIARHRAIDRLRRRSNVPEPLRYDPPSMDEGPEEATINAAISAEVKERVQHLPPIYRDVLEAVYFSGLTQREAAAQLNIPYGTVKSRLRLAFERMARSLRSRGFGP